MPIVDVDAALEGDSSITGDATASYAVLASMSGDSSEVANAGLLFSVTSSLAGDSSETANAGLRFQVASSLSGDSSESAGATAAYRATASLLGGSSETAAIGLRLPLSGSLSGGSSFTASGGEAEALTIFPPIIGSSMFEADMSWKAHPGKPVPKPSVNAAATLRQFIDATGTGRTTSKTRPANKSVVDPNPPRKPFKPR